MNTIDRKVFLQRAGALAVGATLAGTALQPSEVEAAPSRGAVTLRFATWQWSEPNTKDTWAQLVRKFEHENPAITIQPVNIPYPSYQSTMLVQMTGGSSPDIIATEDSFVKQWIVQNFLAPLDDLLPMAQYQGKLLPTVDTARSNGRLYAMLLQSLTYAIIYNAAIFAKAGITAPPRTPDEFLDVARRTTKAPAQYGYAARTTTDQEDGWWYDLANWIFGFGGQWASNGHPTVDHPNNIKAVEFYKRLYDAGVMPKGTDAATYRRMFAQGKVAMLIDNSDNLGIFKAQNPALYPMIKAAPTPFANKASAYEASFLSVGSGSKNKAEAGRFIAFMVRPDNLKTFLSATDVAQGPYKGNILGSTFLRQNPWANAYLSDVGHAVEPQGLEQYTSKFSKFVLDHVEASLVGGVPVAASLRDAQQALVAALPHR